MKTFLKFLEQKGLKDVLYAKCWWNKERVPKNKDELRQLAREFGKEKMAWWLVFSSDVSEYAKLDGKALSKKQLLVISAYLGVMSWLLGIYFVPGFLAASIYLKSPLWQELVKFFFEKKVEEYVKIYKEVEIMVGGLELRSPENGYVGSLKGIVDSFEFESHVQYLVGMNEADFAQYENQLISKFESEEIWEFVNYVELMRDKTPKQFETEFKNDISKLRYHSKKFGEVVDVNDARKDIYYRLFSYTKRLLWQVVPGEGNGTQMMNILHEKLKSVNQTSTLEESLRAACLLSHGNNIIELLSVLTKNLLLKYHPDKNQDEKSKEIYDKLEKIYRAVKTISQTYDNYTTVALCDLKEFLGYKLEEITEENVRYYLVMQYTPFDNYSLGMLERYKEEKTVTSYTRDNMLRKFRRLVEIERKLLTEDDKEEIKKLKAEKRNIEDEQKDLFAHLKSQLKKLQSYYKDIQKAYEYDIHKTKYGLCKSNFEEFKSGRFQGSAKNDYDDYKNIKRAERLERELEHLKNEEKDIEAFFSKTAKIKKESMALVGTLLIGTSASVFSYGKSIGQIKYTGSILAIILACGGGFLASIATSEYWKNTKLRSRDTKYDYLQEYKKLCREYEKLAKKTSSASSAGPIKELEKKAESLEGKFKTLSESEKEFKLDVAGAKERSIKNKQEIKTLIQGRDAAEAKAEKERKAKEEERRAKEEERKGRETAEAKAEIAEAKAEVAEAKVDAAEAKAEVAEAKADTYKSLLLQIKRGELPLSALDGIELESAAGPSRKQ